MMNYNLKIYSIVLFISCTFSTFSQIKTEKETRIKLKALPEAVQKLVETLPKQSKQLKFYKEVDGITESFEVKFKHNSKRYSMEFSKQGKLEDIEVLKKLKHINAKAQKAITAYFTSKYSKISIIKLQKQYVFTAKTSEDNFIKQVLANTGNLTVNFEIVAETKQQNQRQIKEFTFNAFGQYINSRPVILPNYQHVLY